MEGFYVLVFLLKDPADLAKEHLKVYLRIRPFSAAEIENGESQVNNERELSIWGTCSMFATLLSRCLQCIYS